MIPYFIVVAPTNEYLHGGGTEDTWASKLLPLATDSNVVALVRATETFY